MNAAAARPLAWGDCQKRFAEFEGDLPGGGSEWLRQARRASLARFSERGFPTEKDEAWRFTPVGAVSGASFALAGSGGKSAAIAPAPLADFPAHRLVFLDGAYRPELSSVSGLPAGVLLASLGETLRSRPGEVEPYLAFSGADAFGALNGALFTDGLFLKLSKGVVLDRPIHLLFSTGAAGKTAAMAHWRNLIVLEPGAQAQIIEEYHGDGACLANASTDIRVGEGARLEHSLIQSQSPESFFVSGLRARLDRAAFFRGRNYSFGSALARADAAIFLAGEGAECELSGLVLARGRQHIDHHTLIDHAAPRGTSRELFKGVLDGHAKSVFDGAIVVRPEAQKTDARVYNKNLLLSDTALANTKPVFQINANDVQCKHGAAVGQLSQDALFYFRSRGIGAAEARRLLVQGFAGEVLEGASPAPLKDALERRLSAWLDGREG